MTSRNLLSRARFTASHDMFSAEITGYRKREAEFRGRRLIFVDTQHAHPGRPFFMRKEKRPVDLLLK
jgi:hypothetical protein